MKIFDRMLMHNGMAGITVGIIALEEDGVVQVFGTIAAARTGIDEWRRKTGFNMANGRLNKFSIHVAEDGVREALAACNTNRRSHDSFDTIFLMGEYIGNDIRKDLFGSIRDIVRNVEQRRSLVQVRKNLTSILPRSAALIPASTEEDDGVSIPSFSTWPEYASAYPTLSEPERSVEASPVSIASFNLDGAFDLGGEC